MGRRAHASASSSRSVKELGGGTPRCNELWRCRASGATKITAGKLPARGCCEASSGPDRVGASNAEKSSYLTRRESGSRNHHEGAAGGRGSFPSPDAPFGTQDERIHLRGT